MPVLRPLPRKVADLHVQEVGGEFVVVDQTTQLAHALTGAAAALWAAIDQDMWPPVSAEELDQAVAELQALGLIESPGLSRRVLLTRAGTVAVAGTVISIVLPMASAAASGGPVPPSAELSGPETATSNQTVTMHLLVGPTTPGGPTPTGTAGLWWRRADRPDERADLDRIVSGQGLATFLFSVPESGPATYVAKYHSTHYAYTDTESNTLTVTIVPTRATTAALSGPSAATAGGPDLTFTVSVADADNGIPDGKVTLLANGVAVPGNANIRLTLGSATFTVPVPGPGTTAYVAHFIPTFANMFSACDSNTVSTTVVAAPPL